MVRLARTMATLALLVGVPITQASAAPAERLAVVPTANEWLTKATHACPPGASISSISNNGRYVVFTAVCAAGPVVGGFLNGFGAGQLGLTVNELFVRDLVTNVTTGVTYAADGSSSNNTATGGVISDDGRRVFFSSPANDLVPGDTNDFDDVFMRDLLTGTTTRLSQSTAGVQANSFSFGPSIAADSHTVSFTSLATNLVPSALPKRGIYLADVTAKTLSQPVRVTSPEFASGGITSDGLHILLSRSKFGFQMGNFIRDMRTGVETRFDMNWKGDRANSETEGASVSSSGRYVTWVTRASDVVRGDTLGGYDVFERDVKLGITRRVSAPITDLGPGISAWGTQISRNGRFVVFSVTQANSSGRLTPLSQLYMADLAAGTINVVSATGPGVPSNGYEDNGSPGNFRLSGDGRYVAFASAAKNLDDNDDGVTDVYVRFAVRPTVTLATPTTLARGTTTTVTLHGTGFLSNTRLAVSGTGVTVGSVTFVDGKTLSATISIAADAAAGARSITPTNPGSGPGSLRGSTGNPCSSCLTVG